MFILYFHLCGRLNDRTYGIFINLQLGEEGSSCCINNRGMDHCVQVGLMESTWDVQLEKSLCRMGQGSWNLPYSEYGLTFIV